MIKTKALAIILLFSACKARTDFNTVNIRLDRSSTGWHFIELQVQGPKENYKTAEVKFAKGEFLDSAVVSDFDAVDYNVYDEKGNEIAEQMQLANVITHTNQKKYFTFYNPTEADKMQVKHWLPNDPMYDEIMNRQKMRQDSLIK